MTLLEDKLEFARKAYGDRLFYSLHDYYTHTDYNCLSFHYLLFPHQGGVSDVFSWYYCEDCDAGPFSIDGTCWIDYHEDNDTETRVCGCCAVKRGYKVINTEHGLSFSSV